MSLFFGHSLLATKVKVYSIYATVVGKVAFKDFYGLRYYLWKDTRLNSTIADGTRTDDTNVIHHTFKVLKALNKNKKSIKCFDVGAYIGVVSLAMLKELNTGGVIFAFEPVSTNYQRLLDNIKLNRTSSISPQKLAVTNYLGDAIISIGDEAGDSYLTDQHCRKPTLDEERKNITEIVPTTTIEAFANDQSIDCIDLLKIDVEGAELQVLEGASNMLKNGRITYIICEIFEDSVGMIEIPKMLKRLGYEIYYMVRNGDFLVRDVKNYPKTGFKSMMNFLAISSNAPAFSNGDGLDVRG